MSKSTHGQKSPTPGQLRRRKRADARRLEILRAAGRVFRARGFAVAGMRDIALAADLSSANLYHYFRGKDEILFYCQDASLDRLLEQLETATRASGPVLDRLRTLAVEHVVCLLDEAYGFAAHMEVDALPAPLRDAIVAKRDAYEKGVRALVDTGMRRREFRRVNPVLATRALLGSLNWTARWFRSDGPVSARGVADAIADFVVTGLGSDRSRQGPHTTLALRRTGAPATAIRGTASRAGRSGPVVES